MSSAADWFDKWILTCWPGIECGDAGGWVSGIGALIVVGFSAYQIYDTRRERLIEKRNKSDALGALMLEDISSVMSRCYVSIELFQDVHSGTKVKAATILKRTTFEELRSMEALRHAFSDLPVESRVPISQLLMLMSRINSTVDDITRELERNVASHGLNAPLDRHQIDVLAGFCDLIRTTAMQAAPFAVAMRHTPDQADVWQLEEWDNEIDKMNQKMQGK